MSLEDFDFDYDIWNERSLPTVVPREEWGALPPKEPPETYEDLPRYAAFTYNTGGEKCTTYEECTQRLRELQKFHMDVLGFSDIGFNFVIGGDGSIFECRGWKGAAPKELNMPEYHRNKIDIAWIGNNISSEDMPPRPMGLAYKLLKYGTDNKLFYDDYEIYGLREMAPKSRRELEERVEESPMAFL